MIRNVLAQCVGVSAALVSVNAAAFEQHEAHVHGEAVLNIVVEGGNIEAHFQSPQMNLTGFEHQAESGADKALLAQTLVKLQDTSALINLPDQAQCKGVKVAASNSDIVLDDSFKEEHANEHEHEHEHEHEQSAHKDMQASYVFKCQNPAALDQIDVKFMQAFQGIEKLDVNLLIGSKAKSVELKAGLSVIKF